MLLISNITGKTFAQTCNLKAPGIELILLTSKATGE